MIRQENINFTISELEDMIPFERDLYVDLLRDHIEQISEMQQNNSQQKHYS